ncbi:Mannitol dehydrogenase [Phytophthora megakarya]|uniref:Mannitol dehydrogenase n=1 Tax=Phytophthora megakarya TaxID=4795 RepID=A0A225VW80_9STRA|nr:Mannitol dehydrogenase [Phytophthora megakarya]
MFTLKVDNVPFQIGSDELRELFSKFGEIGDVYIPRARGSNESRGFAFVRFVEKRDAEDAIEGMEGQEFQGRDLRVQFAKQRRPDNPREFYSRGGDGGDRYGDDRRGGGRYGDDRRGGDRYGGDRYGDDRRGGRYDDRRDDRPRRRSRSRSPDRRDRGRDRDRSRSRSPRPRSRSPRRSASPRRD